MAKRVEDQEKTSQYNKRYLEKMKKERPWRRTYANIMNRCCWSKKGTRQFKDYKDRGIRCIISIDELKELWFRDNASNMKSPTIDRIDPDGDYSIDNCRYVERSFNASRARVNHMSRVKSDLRFGKKPSSVFKGVEKRKESFYVNIYCNKKPIRIRSIKDEKLAGFIYDVIVYGICGKNARFNFEDILFDTVERLKKG